jgi:hypothetical protein
MRRGQLLKASLTLLIGQCEEGIDNFVLGGSSGQATNGGGHASHLTRSNIDDFYWWLLELMKMGSDFFINSIVPL